MLDHRIIGATVVDGTGAPAVVADIGIRDGRIVTIVEPGMLHEEALETFDATGLIVSPGFVDMHTHYDAQLFLGSVRCSIERSRRYLSDRG